MCCCLDFDVLLPEFTTQVATYVDDTGGAQIERTLEFQCNTNSNDNCRDKVGVVG